MSYFVKKLLGTMLFFTFIFWGAGTLHYTAGWLYVSMGVLMLILEQTVFRIDPALSLERAQSKENTQAWDKNILLLSFLCTLAMFVTAGLDSGRFHWSPEYPLYLQMTGLLLTGLGQLIFLIAQKQNKFFSSTVRIQSDRGHQVCDTGLYSIVRHPGYLGSLIQSLGFPLLFGSNWSILPVSLLILLQLLRIHLEDKTLKGELNGYPDYSLRVKYKIIPGIW